MIRMIAGCLLASWATMGHTMVQETQPSTPAEQKSPQRTVPTEDVVPFSGREEQQVFIPNLTGTISLDAQLDEPQWQQANHITLDLVVQPFENTAAPVKTDVYVFEDGQTLYVAFVAEDPNPNAIRAFYRDRDKIWNDDLVGIKLDTFNNDRLAYQFFVNPFGVQADAIENEMTGNESDSWNAIWSSYGRITDTGYIVEIAIPLRAMNFNESDQDKTWGAEFVRFYPREDRLRLSNLPQDRNNACTLCQMGDVSGFKQATQGNNLAIVPTAVLGKGKVRDVFAEQPEWESVDTSELGLDVTWGITPQISLQATLNPDFSQVESDVAQVSINNTFSLYFDERRPFFVENAGYFTSNQNLVYTRNIGAPDFGGKVTGQTGQHTFGVFVANDERTTFIVPGNIGSDVVSLDTKSMNGAVRYRYDFSQDLSVGYVGTYRDADDYHNYVNGVDAKYRITDQDTLEVQYVFSDTLYPEALFRDFCSNDCEIADDYSETALRTQKDDSFTGTAWRVNYSHEERDWFFSADHFDNDEDFRADLGFETKADFVKSVVGGGYLWWADTGWWNRIRINGDWDITHNKDGEFIERELEAYVSVRGTLQSFLELGTVRRERTGLRFDPSTLAVEGNTDRFDEKQIMVYGETRPTPLLFVSTFASTGDKIDFANNRLGDEVYTESQVDMNIGLHAQLSVMHTFNSMKVDDASLFTVRLTDARFTYQFDPLQYIRLIVSYNNISRNPDNYFFEVDPKTRTLGGQLLYSYKLNPLTKFFVGVGSAAIENAPLMSLKETEKSIFMKFSYAWLR